MSVSFGVCVVMKKLLACSTILIPLLVLISLISLLMITSLARRSYYKRSFKKFENIVLIDKEKWPDFYRATFEFLEGQSVDKMSVLSWQPGTENVYLIIFWFGLSEIWDSPPDNIPEYINNAKILTVKNRKNEFQISNFHIIHSSLESFSLEPGVIWVIKVSPDLKKHAIPMRLEPLRKNEPIWFYGRESLSIRRTIRLGIVKEVKRNRVRAILDLGGGLSQYLDTLFLDAEGHLVGFRIDKNFDSRGEAYYPSPLLGTLYPVSIIQEIISNADPESIKTPTVTFIERPH